MDYQPHLRRSMTSHRASFLWATLGAVSIAVILWALVGRSSKAARYAELSRTKRLWEYVAPYEFTSTYRAISKRTGVDLISHLYKKAERLENSLLQSGDLQTVIFLAPNIQARQQQVISQMRGLSSEFEYENEISYISTKFSYQAGRQWLQNRPQMGYSESEMVTLRCRPEQIASAQSAFCSITNRVRWGQLTKLWGSPEEFVGRLPDGSQVDLKACQKWLNNSVAAGWMVGVARLSDGVVVPTREMMELKALPAGAANGSHVIRSD